MVIAVPVFTKRDQTKPRQVEPLHSNAVDHPPLRALAMGEMTNGPMSAQRHKDAQTHAPQNKTHPPSKTTRQPQAVVATATGVPSIDRQGLLPSGFRFQNAGDGPAQRYNASAITHPAKILRHDWAGADSCLVVDANRACHAGGSCPLALPSRPAPQARLKPIPPRDTS